MAIKERKQITGTEAQIKGYAGHNGVLAYATDTKHLHVLSGTAGTTTKLANMSDIPAPVDISGKADKTYVDTELAKKQTKGDYATTTALTEGLNKKENAGVCLPLTGGTLTGPLLLTETNHIWAVVDELYKGLELGGGSTFKNGASLFLRNNNATGTEESGQWGLAAHNATSEKEGILIGRTDNIWFNGKVVERLDGFYTTQFTGGFCDVHRYVSGLQIVVAGITVPARTHNVTLTFTRPFINNLYSITAVGETPARILVTTWDSVTATGINLYRKDSNGNYNFSSYIRCAFIGRWL